MSRLAGIGSSPDDNEDLRLRKTVLTLSSTIMASLSSIWIITYALLDRWLAAALPSTYLVASTASIYLFARTHRYKFFRRTQLWLSLLLPFALQWSLGGFENSSAVSLWAFTSPLGALLFVGARRSVPWFAGFVLLVGVSAGIDSTVAADAQRPPEVLVVTFFAMNLIGVATTAFLLLQYFVRAREAEQAKSERLLLNVLPEAVAKRLKNNEGSIADAFTDVTVMFADIVGFTPLAERLTATELVELLDQVFASWDALAIKHGVEKIKTIGDAYMVAAGVPIAREGHALAIADMALEMADQMASVASDVGVSLQVRIGIDTGPVVAGVIGRAKFIYDLWGDTVNTASRMESHALPGTIQVTERTYAWLDGRFALRARGLVDVKGKGPMATYVLLGRAVDRPTEVSS